MARDGHCFMRISFAQRSRNTLSRKVGDITAGPTGVSHAHRKEVAARNVYLVMG
jgi:hypothetical protein